MPTDLETPNAPTAQPASADAQGQQASASVPEESTRVPDESWITEDVKKAMDFDPFTPASDELTPATTTDGSTSTEGAQNAQPVSETEKQPAQQGVPQTQQTTTQPAAQPDQIAALIEQNRQLLQMVQQGATQAQPAQQTGNLQQQQGTADDPLAIVPEYDFQIPDQLMVGLNSEDAGERKAAVAMLIKGTSQAIHRTVAATVSSVVKNLQSQIPAMIQQQAQTVQQSQSIFNDFYDKYPQLKKPELFKVVEMIADQHIKSVGATAWSEKLRDEIGAKVLGTLGIPVTQAPQIQQPAVGQPAMFGGTGASGNRASRPGPLTQADHMADFLNL